MFEAPTYEFWSVFFTAVGVIVLWSKMGRKRIKTYALSRLIKVLGFSDRPAIVLEFLVFVGLGTVVAVAIVQPTNAQQAFAAGLGWTGLLTKST